MTQVSKRLLKKELEEKIYQTFWEVVAKLNKLDEANLFFSDLFTRAERINFIKRLSIAVLLYKGYDWRQICDLLKVSPNTVAKMAAKLKGDGFKMFFAKVEKEENWRQFWKDLAKVYLVVTQGDKVARLGDEGVEQVYFRSKKKSLL